MASFLLRASHDEFWKLGRFIFVSNNTKYTNKTLVWLFRLKYCTKNEECGFASHQNGCIKNQVYFYQLRLGDHHQQPRLDFYTCFSDVSFHCLFILLNVLLKMTKCFGVNNLTTMIINSLVSFGGLVEYDATRKFVCFGVDGVDQNTNHYLWKWRKMLPLFTMQDQLWIVVQRGYFDGVVYCHCLNMCKA